METLMQHKKTANAVLLVLIFLAGFLFVKMVGEIKAYKFIGGGVSISNTITVSGNGEATAPADIANFSFSVVEEDDTVAKAQNTASEKINTALALLKKKGVDEKDIKTSGYNVYPQYDWVREICAVGFSCPGGKQVLRGYQVNQTISVRVRNIDDAGEILAEIGNIGVSNISGLTFTIDNQDDLEREARKDAIKKAKDKAKQLARDLGVSLVRVVSFSEGGGYYPQRFGTVMMESTKIDMAIATVPEIPVGENTVTSNVSITYEIR